MPSLERLGKYRIIEELGRGGMGIVYRGHDEVIGRDVAIKVIHEHTHIEEESLARFYREARSAGRLTHESITTVYDVAEENDVPYLVMELLDGSSLRQLMAKGQRIPLPTALDLALQIGRGLQFAHSRSVVHRDIKPANIQITASGRAKIMDFGIARLESEGTATQSSLGTPSYMSPEQIRESGADQRTDVFSFGVVLYEMLHGSNPFVADSVTAVVYRVLHVDPDPPQLPEDLDPELATDLQHIVARCLVKDPEQRYPGFAEIVRDLQLVHDRYRGVASGEIAASDDLRTLPSPALLEARRRRDTGRETVDVEGPAPGHSRLAPAWIAGGIAVIIIALIASWGLQKRFDTAPTDSPPMSRRMAETARENMLGAWSSIDETRLTLEGRRTLDQARERATDGDEFLEDDRFEAARAAFGDANRLIVEAAQLVRSDMADAGLDPAGGTQAEGTPGTAGAFGTTGALGTPGASGAAGATVDADHASSRESASEQLVAEPIAEAIASGTGSGGAATPPVEQRDRTTRDRTNTARPTSDRPPSEPAGERAPDPASNPTDSKSVASNTVAPDEAESAPAESTPVESSEAAPEPAATDPGALVDQAATALLDALKSAMVDGDWSGLPQSVTAYYKRQRDNLTKEFDITRVMVEHSSPSFEGESARMRVTLSIFFQQKGTETLQSVPVERHWQWAVREGRALVTSVQD